MSSQVLLFIHVISTLFMCGVIWFVQVVHYPLFARVGVTSFKLYEQEHARRTTWVVAAPMLLELGSGVALLIMGPAGVPVSLHVFGLVLLAVIWLSTAAAQVPCHRRLASGFDPETWRSLLKSNWWRTFGWSLRAVVGCVMLALASG